MSFWSRFANVFRGNRLNNEIDEELQSHLDEAIEHGRDAREARIALGPALRLREQSRDVRMIASLDSLRADAVFGWRQLRKNGVVSGAAILSLALAVGACTSAFRLIDAVLLRPLPVAHPERLYFLTYQYPDQQTGKTAIGDHYDYPRFLRLRDAVKDQAELMAISGAPQIGITYSTDNEMEKAWRQYISGWAFETLGIRPALGRVLTAADDDKPGAHPNAVLSYHYWSSRLGRDPGVIGRSFRTGNDVYTIVGVAQEGFTGTEPGSLTDIFIPPTMNTRAVQNPDWSWFRIWVQLKPGVEPGPVLDKLQALNRAHREERVKQWGTLGIRAELQAAFINGRVALEPAAAGVSSLQKEYRRSIAILGVLVLLVLLIACANVANLMTAQASARAREMALRVSIGAGRRRLIQLVLVESAILALIATVLGALFAAWAAPAVVGMINPPDQPVRLVLPVDWRVLGFQLLLTVGVTFLFGLGPALRASAVRPVSALKGAEEVHSRQRLMGVLASSQVAFCLLVHFVAGLFIATFDRLASQPTGFHSERVLAIEAVARSNKPEPALWWAQVANHLRGLPEVESAALCGWALMSGNGWTSDVRVNGVEGKTTDTPYFLSVSPRFMETMRIPLIAGRDFREDDSYPAVALVNETFARRYFPDGHAVGRSFERMIDRKFVTTQIVGIVGDARYRTMREELRPTVYVPFNTTTDSGGLINKDWGTFVVRTKLENPVQLASVLREQVQQARSEFRVSNILTQEEIVEKHTIRERLMARLSLFFAVVALLLAGVGLYGVLNYSVLRKRKEIGIRVALGAQPGDVARKLATQLFGQLFIGAGVGLAAGLASERYIETLLYQVKVTDTAMLAIPVLTVGAAALMAALPPILHAVRIDPAVTLRSE